MPRTLKFNSCSFMQVSLNAVNLLFLCYLIVYALACPTPALIGAVAFEIAYYFLLVCYRIWKSKQKKSNDQIELDVLHENWKALRRVRTTYRLTVISLSMLLFAYLSIDLIALIAAKCGNLDTACAIYRVIAPPASPTIHPGFSMELLAGAYIESKQFRSAEPIILAAEKLRRSLVGEHHELIADIYANLGDLYAKAEQNDQAENYYIRSIALTKELNLRQGYGSPLTKLGSLYTKEHRFPEATAAFKEALEIRSRIFGNQSAKVAETLAANVELLRAQGKSEQAKFLEKQIVVAADKPKTYIETTVLPVSISLASVIVFWKRDRILLLAANLLKSSRHQ